MHPFFIYLIQVNIALALFYLLYAIVLRGDTFLRLRRIYFLSVIIFSLFYPFFTMPFLSDIWISRPSGLEGAAATIIMGGSGRAMVSEGGVSMPMAVSWEKILSLSYITITLGVILRFIFQLLSIYGIWLKSEKQIIAGNPIYRLKDDITPFSFFNLIFIHTGKHSETELFQILLHEQTHVRQWHSIDIMLMELVCLFSWWNPFVWLMKREMAMNLEYLADSCVLREGVDSREYQYHLLRLTYHETAVQIVNNFNVSQLKQRIMMMNKTKSPPLKLAKYLLIFPLAFLLVFANSCANRDKKSGGDEAAEMTAPGSTEMPGIIPEEPDTPIVDNSEIFVVVEEQPTFPGGNAAMMRFLSDNIKYPVVAQDNGIQGRVIVNFVVEKDGRLSDFNVVRSIDPLLDAEALRVLESMPNWTPGKQRGEAVRVRFTLPVVFKIQS
ncbi:MAG: TonB family protein [Bacteroidales bacterium]|nr:TonB family protein [Bacteroidales bacterium]